MFRLIPISFCLMIEATQLFVIYSTIYLKINKYVCTILTGNTNVNI